MDLYARLQPLLDALPDASSPAAQDEPLKLAIVGIPNSVRPGPSHRLHSCLVQVKSCRAPCWPYMQASAQVRPALTHGHDMQGKSTLVNQLLGSQRMLTGAEAGLTRDAATTPLVHGQQRILLTDTAGWLQHSSLPKADAFGYVLRSAPVQLQKAAADLCCLQRCTGRGCQQAD